MVNYSSSGRWSASSPPHPLKESLSSSSSSSRRQQAWLSDPEMDRKKRIAGYKAYGVESRVKASIKNGFRWFRSKCSEFIHGY